MTDVHLLRCTVTHYRVDYGPDPHPLGGRLVETPREETTGWHVRDGWLYLHNSAASARLDDLIAGAHRGRGWMAQNGTRPAYVSGEGWGGRNWPRVYVGAEALLELEKELS